LNNASSIINMRLKLLSKQAVNCPGLGDCLGQIDQSLRRMTDTVEALKNVRRIVLTDYVPGTKMLDLKRSVSEEDHELTASQHSS
jgi:hypothetical protein